MDKFGLILETKLSLNSQAVIAPLVRRFLYLRTMRWGMTFYGRG